MSVLNSLIKIDLAEQEFFLMSRFESSKKLSIFLLNVNECKAFKGYATDIDLRSQAANINMIFNDFLSVTTKALTKKETENVKFLYCLDKNCENFIFRWKTIDAEETIISIGNVKTNETDYGSVIKVIFSMLSNELTNLNAKVMNMEKDLSNFKKERDDAVKLVSDITDVKEQVENELYSKFILVLNEKKEKIRELKRSRSGSPINYAPSKKVKPSRSVKVHQISDSSGNSESDEEKINIAGPSSAKHNISLPFLDDDVNCAILPSPSKKRVRQKHVTKRIDFRENDSIKKRNIAAESESEDELLLNL